MNAKLAHQYAWVRLLPVVSRVAVRLAFAGTSAFAAAMLQRLCAHHYTPLFVLTKADSRSGRGKKRTSSAVANCAHDSGIMIYTPAYLSEAAISELERHTIDVLIVVAYGHLIPPKLLALPTFGCWNIHTSLLPAYRGAAPIEHALLDGVACTGVTLMQMDSGLDTGNILSQESFSLDDDDTKESVSARMLDIAQQLLFQQLRSLAVGVVPLSRPQGTVGVSYANKINKDQLWVDWHTKADVVDRTVRAFYPHTRTLYKDTAVKLLKTTVSGECTPSDAVRQPPGTIVAFDKNGILVQCREGQLLLQAIQLAGKQPVAGRALFNGYRQLFKQATCFTGQVR